MLGMMILPTPRGQHRLDRVEVRPLEQAPVPFAPRRARSHVSGMAVPSGPALVPDLVGRGLELGSL